MGCAGTSRLQRNTFFYEVVVVSVLFLTRVSQYNNCQFLLLEKVLSLMTFKLILTSNIDIGHRNCCDKGLMKLAKC